MGTILDTISAVFLFTRESYGKHHPSSQQGNITRKLDAESVSLDAHDAEIYYVSRALILYFVLSSLSVV